VNRSIIKPQTLKGFRDYLPSAMMARERLIETARAVYRSFGFSPIDTPALEYSEILLGKGGEETDKQMFRFHDQGNRDVSMRFDLTIPFARFAAQHLHELVLPFKRYHIGTVWRAEKPQKGRFREFMQCDFDTIGTTSNASDIETLFVIHDLMEAIGFQDFTIRINNRLILNGLLEKLHLEEHSAGVLRALDKLSKIGVENVQSELVEKVGIETGQAREILRLVGVEGSPEEILSQLENSGLDSEKAAEGIQRLRELLRACQQAKIPSERVKLDLSIARGLDYYTGTIYETFLNERLSFGSVCSGGRYDNLAELFTKQELPGVGASLGLDRLLAAMEDLGLLAESKTPAPILVTCFLKERAADYLRIGRLLRKANLAAEVFPDSKPLGKQLKYASQKGFRIALIAGENEFESDHWQVKDLSTGTQQEVPESELVATVEDILAS